MQVKWHRQHLDRLLLLLHLQLPLQSPHETDKSTDVVGPPDVFTYKLPPLENFVPPGGCPLGVTVTVTYSVFKTVTSSLSPYFNVGSVSSALTVIEKEKHMATTINNETIFLNFFILALPSLAYFNVIVVCPLPPPLFNDFGQLYL